MFISFLAASFLHFLFFCFVFCFFETFLEVFFPFATLSSVPRSTQGESEKGLEGLDFVAPIFGYSFILICGFHVC